LHGKLQIAWQTSHPLITLLRERYGNIKNACIHFFSNLIDLYHSGRQPQGRGPVPVREEFVTGPYHFPS